MTTPFNHTVYEFAVRNDSGEDIPAFAVMKIDDAEAVSGRLVYVVKKPDAEFQRRYLINGPFVIPDGGSGNGTFATAENPATALRNDDADPDDYGSVWGVASGSWELTRFYPGDFTMQGPCGDERGLFVQTTVVSFYGQLNEALAFGDEAEVQVLGFVDDGSTNDSGMTVVAKDGFLESGQSLDNDAIVKVEY